MRLASILMFVLLAGCPESKSSCPSPFQMCGTVCTATQVDVANCGGCGNACAAGQVCANGACSCPEGATSCAGVCIDLQNSNANCGACANPCTPGQVCSNGACGATCASGYATCGSGATAYCAKTASDSENCGTCGMICPSGQRCVGGMCMASCPSGTTDCMGRCVSLMSDAAHCGMCGMACPTGERCAAGACDCGASTLSLGRMQSCWLRSDGTVVCAGGLNLSCYGAQVPGGTGSLCGGFSGFGMVPPTVLTDFGSVKAIDAGDGFLCALKNDGTVWCAGSNLSGKLGDASVAPSPSPKPVQVRDSASTFLSGVAQISAGGNHACALKTNGQIWCWGQGVAGQLGTGLVNSSTAIQATLPGGIGTPKKVVCGFDHTCAISGSDGVWCWGSNQFGQIGNGTVGGNLPPTEVGNLTQVSDLITEFDFTCAQRTDKSLRCWGANHQGTIGFLPGVLNPVPTPSPLPLVGAAEQVAVGSGHACVLKADGTVLCWGRNARAELGDGTRDTSSTSGESNGTNVHGNPSPSPRPVLTPAGTPLIAKSIAASHGHTCAIVGASNHPWCWGNNTKGQAALTVPISNLARPVSSCGY